MNQATYSLAHNEIVDKSQLSQNRNLFVPNITNRYLW